MNMRHLITLCAAAALLAACGPRENTDSTTPTGETPTPTVGDSAGGTPDESMGGATGTTPGDAPGDATTVPGETPPPDASQNPPPPSDGQQ